MNVVFTGVTGTKKELVMKALKDARARLVLPEYIDYTDVDRHFGDPGEPQDIEAVLADGEIFQIRNDWKRAFQAATTALGQGGTLTDQYLAVHATYFFRGRPSIPVDIQAFIDFRPNAFVTLINDCYSTWWRVQRKEAEAQRGSYLRLQDILRWRQFDLWVVQQLVNDLSAFLGAPIPHYLLAVKHPVETLYGLLYQPATLTLYGAHPISDIRYQPNSRELLAEVEGNYRVRLRQRFVLIEPATIDEKPLERVYQDQIGLDPPPHAGATVQLRREDRLPVFVPMVPDEDDVFLPGWLELPAEEVYQAAILKDKAGKTEIDHQINERDFWLVRMTKRTVGYRPYWAGYCPLGARGVIAELELARRLRKMPRYLRKPEDIPARGASPLRDEVQPVDSMEALMTALERDERGGK